MYYRLAILALCSVPVLAFAQTADDTKATVEYLQSLQQPDGGFLSAAPSPKADRKASSSLRATTAAFRALKYCDSTPLDRDKAATFVAACFDKNAGAFADVPGGKPDVASTAVGLMAVAEFKLDPAPYAEKSLQFLSENAREFEEVRIAAAGYEAVKMQPAQPVKERWTKMLQAMMNGDGTSGRGDGKVRATGSVIVTWLRLEQKLEASVELRTTLVNGQRDDGGYGRAGAKGSDLETGYRVMRADHMLSLQPKQPEQMRAFIAKCRNADGGYGVEPGQPSSVGGTYFARTILHWLK